jgi:capsular exopolysaccharide synthesis family protein
MTANPLSPIPPLGPTTGMAPAQANGRFKPIDPLRVLRQHWLKLVVALFAGCALGVGLFFLLLVVAPVYTSEAAYEVKPPMGDPLGAPGAINFRTDEEVIQMAMNTEIARIRSESILAEALERPEIKQTQWYQGFVTAGGGVDFNAAREDLMENVLSFSPMPKSSIFMARASTGVEADAAGILVAVNQVYLNRLQREDEQESVDRTRGFRQLLDETEDNVQRYQNELASFAALNDVDTLDDRNNAAFLEYQLLIEQQTMLNISLQQARTQLATVERQIKEGTFEPTGEDIMFVENHPAVFGHTQRLQQLKEMRRSAAEKWGENHVQTRALGEDLAAAETERRIEYDRQMNVLQQQKLETAQTAIASLENNLRQIQPNLQQARQAMQDLTSKLTRYQQIQRNLEEAREQVVRIGEAIQTERARQVRPDATEVRQYLPPTTAEITSPQWFLIPGVALFVLALTTGLIFLIELLDQRVKAPMDVKMLQDGAEVLGVLPDANEDPSGRAKIDRIVERQPSGLLAEMFRQTRTAILAKMDRRGYKSLLVAGAQKGAGTTTVINNLATSLALNGRNVLILDANLRRPGQANLLGLRTEIGLVDVLSGKASLEDAIQSTSDLSLSVLGVGRAEGASPELFESEAFRQMLAELEKQYDMVLIDSPPALLASDCEMLAKHVDAIAIICRANVDKRGMIGRMMSKLDGQRADLLGVILNGVRSSAGGYFRKNYRDFYQYAQGNGREVAEARTPADRQLTAAGR